MGVTKISKAYSASWYSAIMLLVMILCGSIRGNTLHERPCDEIYVVGEGETLNTISVKCSDPFIVERNPHIQDPDDVFPGLVIQIVPTNTNI
ncbi:hypothetical protein Lal_00011993 [Lupinus albus]|nr:hypothetical protein Lal_00011993 [Lupinus albus]